jgi:hypothetical protein
MSALTASAAAQGLERPNFMWYVAEDLNPYVGAYGDATARTPNIDRLAREGVRFETAYSASPVRALRTGLADSTIVFFFADNGGVLPRSKRFANDDGLRVPLIIRVPKKFQNLTQGPRLLKVELSETSVMARTSTTSFSGCLYPIVGLLAGCLGCIPGCVRRLHGPRHQSAALGARRRLALLPVAYLMGRAGAGRGHFRSTQRACQLGLLHRAPDSNDADHDPGRREAHGTSRAPTPSAARAIGAARPRSLPSLGIVVCHNHSRHGGRSLALERGSRAPARHKID